jgi:hypothetical protein
VTIGKTGGLDFEMGEGDERINALRIGRAYASVFPEPVSAITTKSRGESEKESEIGKLASWTAVGLENDK